MIIKFIQMNILMLKATHRNDFYTENFSSDFTMKNRNKILQKIQQSQMRRLSDSNSPIQNKYCVENLKTEYEFENDDTEINIPELRTRTKNANGKHPICNFQEMDRIDADKTPEWNYGKKHLDWLPENEKHLDLQILMQGSNDQNVIGEAHSNSLKNNIEEKRPCDQNNLLIPSKDSKFGKERIIQDNFDPKEYADVYQYFEQKRNKNLISFIPKERISHTDSKILDRLQIVASKSHENPKNDIIRSNPKLKAIEADNIKMSKAISYYCGEPSSYLEDEESFVIANSEENALNSDFEKKIIPISANPSLKDVLVHQNSATFLIPKSLVEANMDFDD